MVPPRGKNEENNYSACVEMKIVCVTNMDSKLSEHCSDNS